MTAADLQAALLRAHQGAGLLRLPRTSHAVAEALLALARESGCGGCGLIDGCDCCAGCGASPAEECRCESER